MLRIITISILFIFISSSSQAQKIIYSANFEEKKIDSAWQTISGNWFIGDVDEMRIAPAEGGYRYVLCMDGKNSKTENLIRLFIDLPDSIKKYKKITLSFYYYFIANAAKAKVETEFYQKEMKDGTRGKLWSTSLLYVKGRWSRVKKTFIIPKNTNQFRILFSGKSSPLQKNTIVCFDNIAISAL